MRDDPCLNIENVIEFVYWLEKNRIPYYGPISSGIIYPCVDDIKKLDEVYDFVSGLNGSVGSVFGDGILKKKLVPINKKFELNGLKEKFDPVHIMNRGKLI